MTNLRALVRTVLAAIVVGALGFSGGACSHDEAAGLPPGGDNRLAQLQRDNSFLQRQVELAEGKDFYLVLDPAASNLTLMLNGAELQRYPVLGLLVGQPRVSWFSRRDARPWQDVVWAHGELDPPRQLDRLVIQAAPPSKDAPEPEAPVVPPTPEEKYPVPSRYHVRFEEGRSIEVRPMDADSQAGRLARLRAWWSAKWNDEIAAVFHRDRDRVRLRLVLNPKDAASLYRSLPPMVRLVILSKDHATAPARVSPGSQRRSP
jgi:hypothetical protein